MNYIPLIIDIVLILLIIISIIRGWKKGFVSCFIDFVGIIIVIIISFWAYTMLSDFLVSNTKWDEKIYSTVYDTLAMKEANSNSEDIQSLVNTGVSQTVNKVVETNAQKATTIAMNVISFAMIFITLQILLIIIKAILNAVTYLPVVKQFNELGGAIFNALVMIIKIFMLLALIFFVTKYTKLKSMEVQIDKTNIAKAIYNNNIIKDTILGKIDIKQ